ncbi:hypothetical protein J3R82DRAFT_3298 [Butyriboletus roseoflavus]|nr:hypothetical protein J3R82DRAFT_3298 [Butyriboletus roseoflavus]
MLSNFWSSTPKRNSTPKPAPLTPKLTTTISPEYPPHPSYETQWEHVKPGPPSSPDVDDEATFERLGYSQVYGSDHPRGAPLPPLPSPPAPSVPQLQEEGDRLRQQLETTLAAKRKAESDRERWERKVVDLRSSNYAERKDGSSPKNRREREREREREPSAITVAAVDALKEESEKLKIMLQQQTQQLDAAREEMKQERSQLQSEAEKLKGELYAVREAHRGEVETLQTSLQGHVERVEHLSVDRERVRKDRDSTRGFYIAEIERLKMTHAKETEQVKTALEEVNLDRTQAHSELRKVRKSLDAYAPKLDTSLREIEALRRELSNAKDSKRTTAELKQRLEIQNKELNSAREESSALKKEFNQLLTLLEDRTSELKGAQSFLTTADAFSGAEVTSTLQRLNAEVLQSTAFMAESMVELFLHDTTTQVSKTDEQLAACKRASGTIGGVIVHFLGTKKHRDDPILIQIAFQAYLTYHLRWIACAWIIGGDEGHNRFIDAIYQSVHEKEAQAIAGRWRALTRAHVPSTPFDNSQIAFQIATKIFSGLSDILLTAGCTAPKSDITSALSSKFAEKLSFLVSLAMRVNKIVGEDVTSGDFEVMAVLPATAFDLMTMDDSYDDGGSAKARENTMSKVLCATDLGLRKKTRVGMTGEKQWETKVLLKPKVALESVMDIMDE